MQTAIYSNTYCVNFTQCYANGQLKYSELSNLLQLTAADHAEQLGFGYREMAKNAQSWVLSRVRIEIDRLPRFMEEISIVTWVQDFMGNRSVRNFEVHLHGKKIIGASSFWAVFNMRDRRSENLAAKVDPSIVLPERLATREPFKRIEAEPNYPLSVGYTPKLSDLDIVNHVNNVKYTDWCLDSLPAELVLQRTLKTIDINYLKELRLGQPVVIRQRMNEDSIYFAIARDDKTIFLMEAAT